MHIACCKPKATNVHTDCVILIDFPLQQWLRERVSMLRYTYIACLVRYKYGSNSVKFSDTLTEAPFGLCTHSNEHSCNTEMLCLIPATELKCIRINRHVTSSAELLYVAIKVQPLYRKALGNYIKKSCIRST